MNGAVEGWILLLAFYWQSLNLKYTDKEDLKIYKGTVLFLKSREIYKDEFKNS